jgi:hypothetical protein
MLHEKHQSHNPFCAPSVFDLPLNTEACQQIYATALRRLSRDSQMVERESALTSDFVREQIHRYGADRCLLHPAESEQIFQGVTLDVYQTIKELYCSRLERSIQMVTRILHAMAQRMNAPCLTNEAIWAICLSLEKLRREETVVTIQRNSDLWWIGEIASASLTHLEPSCAQESPPLVVGVIDMTHSRVLSLQIGKQTVREQLRTQVLYEALCSMRQPDPKGVAGLRWHLPAKIVVEKLPGQNWQTWSESIGIPLESSHSSFCFLEDLRDLWENVFSTRKLSPDQRGRVFESALNMTYGTSPQRSCEENERTFSHLCGYMTDPAWLFPALRMLLPAVSAANTHAEGVCCNSLHYTHELLSYWPETPVIVRPSAWTEATAWIYLDGEMLCQAVARELVRRDGSSFPHQLRG